MTTPTQDLAARRREIVRAVADLSEKHDLPMPDSLDIGLAVAGLDKFKIRLRLDANSAEDVARWAEVLGTGPVRSTPTPRSGPTFLAVKSERWDDEGPTMFDARWIDVWSACDLPEGGAE